MSTPIKLVGTFSNSGACSCGVDGVSLDLIHTNSTTTPQTQGWGRTRTVCGTNINISIACTGVGSNDCEDWLLNAFCSGVGFAINRHPDPGCTCDPLYLVWSNLKPSGCCGTDPTFTLTVTE